MLEAIGVDTVCNAVLRFGLTRMTTDADVGTAIASVLSAIRQACAHRKQC